MPSWAWVTSRRSAVLPAFGHAKRNSELVALVSDDDTKRRKLGRKYGVRLIAGYDEYDALLRTGDVDAVYIGLPNHLHKDYAIRAAGPASTCSARSRSRSRSRIAKP